MLFLILYRCTLYSNIDSVNESIKDNNTQSPSSIVISQTKEVSTQTDDVLVNLVSCKKICISKKLKIF